MADYLDEGLVEYDVTVKNLKDILHRAHGKLEEAQGSAKREKVRGDALAQENAKLHVQLEKAHVKLHEADKADRREKYRAEQRLKASKAKTDEALQQVEFYKAKAREAKQEAEYVLHYCQTKHSNL